MNILIDHDVDLKGVGNFFHGRLASSKDAGSDDSRAESLVMKKRNKTSTLNERSTTPLWEPFRLATFVVIRSTYIHRFRHPWRDICTIHQQQQKCRISPSAEYNRQTPRNAANWNNIHRCAEGCIQPRPRLRLLCTETILPINSLSLIFGPNLIMPVLHSSSCRPLMTLLFSRTVDQIIPSTDPTLLCSRS